MKHSLLRVLSAVAAISAWTGSAHANVTLPSGIAVPVGGGAAQLMNGSAANDGINENIDAVARAEAGDIAFEPLCSFQVRFVEKGGGANFGVGYYGASPERPTNAPPRYVPTNNGAGLNTPAAASEMGIAFPFGNVMPGIRTFDDYPAIRALASGAISLALIPNPNGTGGPSATQYAYAERRFNVLCSQCSQPGHWPRALAWRANSAPNRFYVGFEDLDLVDRPGLTGHNGNDLDYDDFLLRVENALPRGSGFPCAVPGAYGVCARGITAASFDGVVTCNSSHVAAAPSCNGLDNDCDGRVDDGPCAQDESCVHGACVPTCDASQCNTGEVCDDSGGCVEAACADVPCGPGERCAGGSCVDACEGIVCPGGLACESGLCVDLCAGVVCGADRVCDRGACVNPCDCAPGRCGDGGACSTTTRACVPAGCEALDCQNGTVCGDTGDGTMGCVDACQGAVCPFGEVCTQGQCVERPFVPPSASSSGGSSSSSSSGGSSSSSGGSSSSSSSSGATGGSSSSGTLGSSSGAEPSEVAPDESGDASGGGCSTGGVGASVSGWGLLIAATAMLRRRARQA